MDFEPVVSEEMEKTAMLLHSLNLISLDPVSNRIQLNRDLKLQFNDIVNAVNNLIQGDPSVLNSTFFNSLASALSLFPNLPSVPDHISTYFNPSYNQQPQPPMHQPPMPPMVMPNIPPQPNQPSQPPYLMINPPSQTSVSHPPPIQDMAPVPPYQYPKPNTIQSHFLYLVSMGELKIRFCPSHSMCSVKDCMCAHDIEELAASQLFHFFHLEPGLRNTELIHKTKMKDLISFFRSKYTSYGNNNLPVASDRWWANIDESLIHKMLHYQFILQSDNFEQYILNHQVPPPGGYRANQPPPNPNPNPVSIAPSYPNPTTDYSNQPIAPSHDSQYHSADPDPNDLLAMTAHGRWGNFVDQTTPSPFLYACQIYHYVHLDPSYITIDILPNPQDFVKLITDFCTNYYSLSHIKPLHIVNTLPSNKQLHDDILNSLFEKKFFSLEGGIVKIQRTNITHHQPPSQSSYHSQPQPQSQSHSQIPSSTSSSLVSSQIPTETYWDDLFNEVHELSEKLALHVYFFLHDDADYAKINSFKWENLIQDFFFRYRLLYTLPKTYFNEKDRALKQLIRWNFFTVNGHHIMVNRYHFFPSNIIQFEHRDSPPTPIEILSLCKSQKWDQVLSFCKNDIEIVATQLFHFLHCDYNVFSRTKKFKNIDNLYQQYYERYEEISGKQIPACVTEDFDTQEKALEYMLEMGFVYKDEFTPESYFVNRDFTVPSTLKSSSSNSNTNKVTKPSNPSSFLPPKPASNPNPNPSSFLPPKPASNPNPNPNSFLPPKNPSTFLPPKSVKTSSSKSKHPEIPKKIKPKNMTLNESLSLASSGQWLQLKECSSSEDYQSFQVYDYLHLDPEYKDVNTLKDWDSFFRHFVERYYSLSKNPVKFIWKVNDAKYRQNAFNNLTRLQLISPQAHGRFTIRRNYGYSPTIPDPSPISPSQSATLPLGTSIHITSSEPKIDYHDKKQAIHSIKKLSKIGKWKTSYCHHQICPHQNPADCEYAHDIETLVACQIYHFLHLHQNYISCKKIRDLSFFLSEFTKYYPSLSKNIVPDNIEYDKKLIKKIIEKCVEYNFLEQDPNNGSHYIISRVN